MDELENSKLKVQSCKEIPSTKPKWFQLLEGTLLDQLSGLEHRFVICRIQFLWFWSFGIWSFLHPLKPEGAVKFWNKTRPSRSLV